MPRIRSIKPEAWRKRVGKMSTEAQLLWVKLVTFADDAGRFPADVGSIVGHGYPHQLVEVLPLIGTWLDEIVAAGLVVIYEVDGEPYGVLPKFRVHQKVNKPTQSRLPEPPLSVKGAFRYDSEIHPVGVREDSRSTTGETPETPETQALPEDSGRAPVLDQRSTTTDQGSGISGGGVARDLTPIVSALAAAGFDSLTIDQHRSPILHALEEFEVPDDIDWFAFGQRLREKRQSGACRSERPDGALRFMFRGLSSLPRVQQPGAGVFAATGGEQARLEARFG